MGLDKDEGIQPFVMLSHFNKDISPITHFHTQTDTHTHTHTHTQIHYEDYGADDKGGSAEGEWCASFLRTFTKRIQEVRMQFSTIHSPII